MIWLDENDEAKAGGDFIERRFGSRLLLVDLIDSRDLGVRVSPSSRWQQLEEQQGFLLLVSQPSGSGGQRQLRGAAVWRRADRVAARLPRVPDLTVDAEFFNQPELWHLADVLGPLRTASDQRTNQDQRLPAAPHFDLIAEYALNRQVVYATHAPALVSWDHIANGAVVARVHKTGGQSVVSHPSRETFDRVSKLRLDTHQPHTLGLEANEVFFLEDGIILLEGQEDVLYLPRVLRDLEMPALENVFGWGVGGAERVGPFLQLFHELGFSKVAVVLDNDKETLASELAGSFRDYLVRTIPAPDIRTKPEQPAKAAKSGLLDAGNATVRPELAEAAANVFRDVADYLREGS